MSGDEIPFDVRALPAERKEDESEAAMPALPEGFDVQGVRFALLQLLYDSLQETRIKRVRDPVLRRVHLEALRIRGYLAQQLFLGLRDHTLQDLEARIRALEDRETLREVPIC